jgi:hypothetical protein
MTQWYPKIAEFDFEGWHEILILEISRCLGRFDVYHD